MTHLDEPDAVAAVAGFARALRERGVPAEQTRLRAAISALALIRLEQPADVYWALRVTLCAGPDDLAPFDELFELWFRGIFRDVSVSPAASVAPTVAAGVLSPSGASRSESAQQTLAVAALYAESLRHRDVVELSARDREEVNRMIALLAPHTRSRPGRRQVPGGRQRVDVRRTVRAMLRDGGEPAQLRYVRRRRKPRRLVLLVDVSASMALYAELLLRFAHAAVRAAPLRTEAFTVGTRLTRVSRQLRLRDPDGALAAAGAAVPDWSGGTRLGESLRAFSDLWGQRGAARGAVVVIASDGWESGDASLLAEQMARLARLAHRVVWVNPHRGKAGFAPLTGGMVAALPSVDDLVAGHSFASLDSLADVITRA